MLRKAAVALVLGTVALSGCGDDEDDAAAKSTPTPTAAATEAASGGVGELEGTYTVTLGKEDGRREVQASWIIKFLADGGVGGAPAMSIQDADSREDIAFATAEPSVEGDTLSLKNQECADFDESAEGPAVITGMYTYTLTGDELDLETAEGSETCKDHIVETILTKKPLKREQ